MSVSFFCFHRLYFFSVLTTDLQSLTFEICLPSYATCRTIAPSAKAGPVLCPPISDFRPLTSGICLRSLTSDFRPLILNSVLCHPSSVVRHLDFRPPCPPILSAIALAEAEASAKEDDFRPLILNSVFCHPLSVFSFSTSLSAEASAKEDDLRLLIRLLSSVICPLLSDL